jgi:hypothetical protein
MAFFSAWRDKNSDLNNEKSKTASLEVKLDSLSKPKLTARIQSIALGQPQGKRGVTSFVMVVEVTNVGMPSIADQWKLKVISKGKSHTGALQAMPKQLVLTGLRPGERVVYTATQALYNISVKDPIATGAKKIGVLLYFVDVPWAEATKDFEVVLTFVDVTGKECTATNLAKDKGGVFTYPGLNP